MEKTQEDKIYRKEIAWLLKEKYRGKMTRSAEQDIEKLKEGFPLAYLIGFVDFLGCRIDLRWRPFIPRPETEFWLEKTLRRLPTKESAGALRCLDIFAGSGAIGIAVLKFLPASQVDFVDIDGKFIKQIKTNLKLNKIASARYRLIRSDIFRQLGDRPLYDYIFANPPYVAEENLDDVQKSVRDFEPKQAVFAGRDGLLFIEPFLRQAGEHLKKGGRIYMEFDPRQKSRIEKMLSDFGYRTWQFFKDQYGFWRWVEILRFPAA